MRPTGRSLRPPPTTASRSPREPDDTVRRSAVHRASRPGGASAAWLQGFMGILIAGQLALLVPGLGPLRLVVRMAVFGVSLLLLALLPGRGRRHPAAQPAMAIVVILGLSLLHPYTNTLLAGAAQAALYVAILAPLFWVSRLRIDLAALRRVVLILWAFHSVSAVFGILQVYFPGRFQPNVSVMITGQGEGYLSQLQITTADGERVLRPMGLTDTPGGAAVAGFYAVLFGLGLILTERRSGLKFCCFGSMLLGMTCLYLAQVRSVLLMLGFCVFALFGLLAWRGEKRKFMVVAGLVTTVILLSFSWAVSLAGASVTDRLGSLVKERPSQVYYRNRGVLLEQTVQELLPQYPLGAGLGRWGMMNLYFGDNSDPQRASLWAELQWTGWILDGGVPLLLAYVAALTLACCTALHIAFLRSAGNLWVWGGILLAYNLGAVAVTFSYSFFVGQGGLEFWLLNAVVYGAALGRRPAASQAGQASLR